MWSRISSLEGSPKSCTWWRAGTVAVLVGVAAMSRLIPHPPNFTPITGMALLGGAVLGHWFPAVGIPLLAMVASDAILGWFVYGYGFFHTTMPFVYGSLVAIVFLSRLLRASASVTKLSAIVLASSTLFFVVTNFGVWFVGVLTGRGLYPPTVEGLWACYVAAIPFFGYTLAGDVFYTTLLFGAWAMLVRRIPGLRPALAVARR